MEKERGSKVIAIIALCIGIVGLSLGFAAFSSNLVIEPSANVTPDSSSFKVVFSKVATSEQAGTLSPILGNGASATINNTSNDTPTISNLKANFVSPGETTKYEFYAYNAGEYQSYLTNITFNNVTGTELTKTCTPESGTTKALVDAACEGITMYINIDGLLADATMNTSGHSIDQAKAHKVVITINYDSNAARADGPFTVTFGDISLTYATTAESQDIPEVYIGWDQSCKLISGTVYEVGSKYTCKFMGDFDNETEVDFYMLQSDLDAGMVYLITVETFGSGMTQYEAQISAEADFLMEYRLNGESFSLPTYGQLYAVDNSETLPSWLHGEYWLASEGGEDVYSVFGDTISSDHSSAGARFVYNLSTI